MRKRLGLGVGLGMGGETPGRLVLLPEKKDKVRVRGRVRVARRHIGRFGLLYEKEGKVRVRVGTS